MTMPHPPQRPPDPRTADPRVQGTHKPDTRLPLAEPTAPPASTPGSAPADRPGQAPDTGPAPLPAQAANQAPPLPDLALPHERDQGPATGTGGPGPVDPVMRQAHEDLQNGLVDTDLRATPGLDAQRRCALVRSAP